MLIRLMLLVLVAGIALDQCVIPEIIFSLGSIPLTKYGTPSTTEIPESVREYLQDHNAFLLENHGALSIGSDVYQAYYRMESLELFAKINLFARLLGNVSVLSEDNVRKILKIRSQWGMDSNYAGCRVDGKFIKSYDGSGDNSGLNRNSGSDNDNELITLSKGELVKLVSEVVGNILNKDVKLNKGN